MTLTREQLAALPSRELDARVMHAVFGWRWMAPKNCSGVADSMPRAVCLAALDALGGR